MRPLKIWNFSCFKLMNRIYIIKSYFLFTTTMRQFKLLLNSYTWFACFLFSSWFEEFVTWHGICFKTRTRLSQLDFWCFATLSFLSMKLKRLSFTFLVCKMRLKSGLLKYFPIDLSCFERCTIWVFLFYFGRNILCFW